LQFFNQKIYNQLIIFSVCFFPFLAHAQNSEPRIDLTRGVSFEIAPHSGMMGSSGIFGLKLSMNYSSFNLELAGEQVIGKTANLYPISINAVLNLATKGALIPYGIVGPGLFVTVPTNTVGDESVTTVGLNFGGGIRYYFNDSFGIRFEAKQYVTSVESERDLHEEILIFQEFSLGATFLFQ